MFVRHLFATSLISFAALVVGVGGFSVVATSTGCSSSSSDGGKKCTITATLDRSVCALTGNFGASLTIDNPYFPLTPGVVYTFEGEEEGAAVVLDITVMNTTEFVGPVETRVVKEEQYEDGELIERSLNYFAQNDEGDVCYFGETTDNYEDGVIVNNDGAWRADEGGNEPGIIMPANPALGDAYEQEYAPDVANDKAEIIAVGESVSVPAGDYTDTLTTDECTPLEKDSYEDKAYASGVGLIYDHGLSLVSVTGP